jgi:hypothetical protein
MASCSRRGGVAPMGLFPGRTRRCAGDVARGPDSMILRGFPWGRRSAGWVGGGDGVGFRMIGETIREKLEQTPFVPFVIRASSGVAYKVSSPDLVVLMKTKVFVAEPRSDRSATVPYLHIAGVEETGNGHGRGKAERGRRRG